MSARWVYLIALAPWVVATDTVGALYCSAGQTTPQPYNDIKWDIPVLGDHGPFSYTQEFPLGETVGGPSRPGFGTIVLGRTHASMGTWATDYYFDGRGIQIWRVLEGATLDVVNDLIFRGVMESPQFAEDRITIPLRDSAALLDEPVQQNRYLGTGGYEGPDELEGRPKPLVIGTAVLTEPVALEHTATGIARPDGKNNALFGRVMQLHDGPILTNLTAIFERGLTFTIVSVPDVTTWTPVGGVVAIDYSRGFARTGSTPIGIISAHVRAHDGDMNHGGIAEELVLRSPHFFAGDIDTATLAQFQADQPADAGLYIADDRTTGQALDTLAQSAGAYWTFGSRQRFTMRQIRWREPVALISAYNLTEPLRHAAALPPVQALRFGGQPAERPLTDTDIGDANLAGDDLLNRLRLTSAYFYKQSEASVVGTRRLLARDLELTSRFMGPTAYQDEATRQFNLLRRSRHEFTATVRLPYESIALGDCVTLSHPDYGLSPGGDFIVRGKQERPGYIVGEDTVELTLWGPREPDENTA